MTRTDSPRRHLSVMTLLILSLGLGLGALTLWAQPEDDADPPRDEAVARPIPEPLREALRQLDDATRQEVLERLAHMGPGDDLTIELPRPWSATPICLAQPSRSGPDPCRVGEAISRMPACRERGDCPAYEAWTRLYGAPRSLPARPELETGDAAEEPE